MSNPIVYVSRLFTGQVGPRLVAALVAIAALSWSSPAFADSVRARARDQAPAASAAKIPSRARLHSLLVQMSADGYSADTATVETIKALDRSAVPVLIGMLDDPSPAIRANIICVLGELRSRDAIEPIVRALKDQFPVNWRAAGALIFMPDERALDDLINLSTVRHYPMLRDNVAMALSRIPSSRSEAALIRLIWDPDEQVRFGAVNSLDSLGKPELTLNNPWLPGAYISNLGRRNRSPVKSVWTDPDTITENPAGDLEHSLNSLGGIAESLFESRPATRVAMELFNLRSNFPWDDLVRILIAELNNPDDKIKKGAAWMLGVTGDARCKAPLEVLAQRKPAWVAEAAKEGWAACKEYSQINSDIANALRRSNDLIADLNALGNTLGGYDITDVVASRFRGGTADERSVIFKALGVSGRLSGVNLLTHAYATARPHDKIQIPFVVGKYRRQRS
jgi:HEAT repeat protein